MNVCIIFFRIFLCIRLAIRFSNIEFHSVFLHKNFVTTCLYYNGRKHAVKILLSRRMASFNIPLNIRHMKFVEDKTSAPS